jgi:hypothetical protein
MIEVPLVGFDEDPFKFGEGLEYAVQVIRSGSLQWSTIMVWVSHATAMDNCRKLAQDGFMSKIRCVRLSRYPPWSICSVHYYREND